MLRKRCDYCRPRGVTLIMVAGVLTILAAMAAGFYTLTISQSKSASRNAESVRAALLVHAGFADAVARLREQVLVKTEDPNDAWYGVDWRNGATRHISYAERDFSKAGQYKSYTRAIGSSLEPNSDRYVVNIVDAASKINVNACDNLGVLLDNLCRVIGPPLVAADKEMIQPARWDLEGAIGYGKNKDDTPANKDIYYETDSEGRSLKLRPGGASQYGDGYAIAAYRSKLKTGRFASIDDVRAALTVVKNAAHPELETLERDVKFNALREYITVDSWVDTNTVCVGKFEWINHSFAIDRDKSWVADDPTNDPLNHRGSLRGCYVSIIYGHGAGQLRKIKTNGIDWIQLDDSNSSQPFVVEPGPTSSYMIIPKWDAKIDPMDPRGGIAPNRLDFAPMGDLQDNPDIDFHRWPLCIHRAPININTASDKVLTALFLGITIQHGHPMAIGTQSDVNAYRQPALGAWSIPDFTVNNPAGHDQEYVIPTFAGIKRIPQDTGMLQLNCKYDDMPGTATELSRNRYLNNNGGLTGSLDFVPGGGDTTEAHELAYRIIQARQRSVDATGKVLASSTDDPDPTTADRDSNFPGYNRGPFKSWDDFYFRVVRPWDDIRSYGDPADSGRSTIPYSGNPGVTRSKEKVSVARMIMAHFNSNTDLLKINPNIEWIDRWGRNFTELEPVLVYDNGNPLWIPGDAAHMWAFQSNRTKIADPVYKGAYSVRSYRYKSDEMIDKTDLNRSTTEFCFHSNGVFEIVSTGQLMKDGAVRAERKTRSVVKIYDVWHETTQAQFARGKFDAPGGIGAPGTNKAGSVTRDSYNTTNRLPLTTQPEALVPLAYQLNKQAKDRDVVDTTTQTGRDCFGIEKRSANMPDSVANLTLPAQYDGQIVLATNTLDSAGDNTTFLASFNGDLDTDTAKGNGRELAKTPGNKQYRVVDTIGLLGALNDTQIDFDPATSDANSAKALTASYLDVFGTINSDRLGSKALARLDETVYWQYSTCRQGDLRSDGVWLGTVGVSGKDATLKYEMKGNYEPDSDAGSTIFMWYKPAWHGTDHREHEFFNATRPGKDYLSRQHRLAKHGRFSNTLNSGNGADDGSSHDKGSDCCLCFTTEGLESEGKQDDLSWSSYLHGGYWKVPYTVGRNFIRESPSFHVQPFRWGSVGAISKPHASIAKNSSSNPAGWWIGDTSTLRDSFIRDAIRPFIDSQRDPEGSTWLPHYFRKDATATTLTVSDIGKSGKSGTSLPQPAAWSWCDGSSDVPVFSINNLNGARDQWIFRSTPSDGTCAVIDELKLCNKAWDSARIGQEQTKCRYYTPDDPGEKSQCPTFTSQSMFESLKGVQAAPVPEMVTLAHVTWTGFTPRFLHDNKSVTRRRTEVFKGRLAKNGPYRGPFDYIQYNLDVYKFVAASEGQTNEGEKNTPALLPGISVSPLGVERPSPTDYKGFVHKNDVGQPHYSRGLQIEVLNKDAVVDGKTFDDPEEYNTFGTVLAPVRVKIADLHYRVRFRYRIDNLVDAVTGNSGKKNVDPSQHFTLDTPVFDDISIKYLQDHVIYLDSKQITE